MVTHWAVATPRRACDHASQLSSWAPPVSRSGAKHSIMTDQAVDYMEAISVVGQDIVDAVSEACSIEQGLTARPNYTPKPGNQA